MFDEFSKAVMFGNTEKVRQMIAAEPGIVNKSDDHGFTALHNAMSEDPNDGLIHLLENGANTNAQNSDGIAPLHLACYAKNAKLLLEHGADKNLRDNQQRTPLHVLASDGSERFEVIQFLLESGADATLKDSKGRTPVEISKNRNDADIVELFEIWSGDLEFDFDD